MPAPAGLAELPELPASLDVAANWMSGAMKALLLLALVVAASDAGAYRGVIYLGETDPRAAEAIAGDFVDLPRLVFVLHDRDAQGKISAASAELHVGAGSVVPELTGARAVAFAPATVEAPLGEMSFALSLPVDVAVPAAGRYALTLLMTPEPDWEEGRVRVLVVGRKLSGDGPSEFRREIDGWFLVRR